MRHRRKVFQQGGMFIRQARRGSRPPWKSRQHTPRYARDVAVLNAASAVAAVRRTPPRRCWQKGERRGGERHSRERYARRPPPPRHALPGQDVCSAWGAVVSTMMTPAQNRYMLGPRSCPCLVAQARGAHVAYAAQVATRPAEVLPLRSVLSTRQREVKRGMPRCVRCRG